MLILILGITLLVVFHGLKRIFPARRSALSKNRFFHLNAHSFSINFDNLRLCNSRIYRAVHFTEISGSCKQRFDAIGYIPACHIDDKGTN